MSDEERRPDEGEASETRRGEPEPEPSTAPTPGASGKKGESQKRGRFPALRGSDRAEMESDLSEEESED